MMPSVLVAVMVSWSATTTSAWTPSTSKVFQRRPRPGSATTATALKSGGGSRIPPSMYIHDGAISTASTAPSTNVRKPTNPTFRFPLPFVTPREPQHAIPSTDSATSTPATVGGAWPHETTAASATSSATPTSKTAVTTVPSSSHGMPWKESICANYTAENAHLFYMPFWEWQMAYMKKHLTNLREVPVCSRLGRDMSYVDNGDGSGDDTATMRMHTCCYTCDEYKLIRLTTLDAGWRTQVFTSLWYPAQSTDPVLGIDLLQFNHAKKHLCIVDFQPLVASDEKPNRSFESLLQPIRSQYPSLQGVMTDRFYNKEDSYFSNQMLLGRHASLSSEDAKLYNYSAKSMVYNDLFPAFTQYVATHVDMIQQQQREHHSITDATVQKERIKACHQAYDTYSAARDPAHGLLAKCFGQEWADDYVYDILFPLAIRGKP